jgi:hypothetical protein
MTTPPSFDDLIGEDVGRDERERLRRVHELLVTAGPPAELAPEIERGPTLGMTLGGPSRRRVTRRTALVAAAVLVLLLAFLAGYIAGNDSTASGRLLNLAGTAQAPRAEAKLRIEPADAAGNWPMTLAARGLPKLPAKGYYEVFLVRNGEIFAPCGGFVVPGGKTVVSVKLNAPYRFEKGDTWVVTKQLPPWGHTGPVVLEPATASA